MSRWKCLHRAVLSLAVLATNPAAAAEIPVKILGFDDMSCRAWAESTNDAEQRALYVVWVRGVLTGHNYANRSQQVSTISSGTVEQHITRYCKSQPRGDFSDAAFRLSDQFSGRNAAITK
ncbi:MAG TPA: HdeA/HdeB family chaperone [Accumulibacter sp.]|uniref:HdeA/HdeB family chaperone n=1 Tax=Accumulibacter sp. TaxID=2053492 RepID=UPI000ED1FB55|nr:HdeA/HdeB family chaperone [Accumulibacter sp.]HCZ17090.1 hypothetical protein [Accumulibacter sp.]HRD92253.1 HdeA/HdeB family chaperone [Accumulibacter sp.]HRF73077.1 HdeA/HdeB family chaperone [Accumulibacter sp.]